MAIGAGVGVGGAAFVIFGATLLYLSFRRRSRSVNVAAPVAQVYEHHTGATAHPTQATAVPGYIQEPQEVSGESARLELQGYHQAHELRVG